MATSEELFDTGVRNLDLEGISSEEPEVMMSELEQVDDDILSLDDLESGAEAGETLDLGAFLADEEDDGDSDVLNFSDLGAMATIEDDSEILSFDDIDQEDGEVTLDDLESTSDLESGELAEEDIIVGETIEDDEEEIDFLDFEDDEVQQDDEIELKIEEELKEDAEPEEFETEGGVDTDLDDLEKKSEEDLDLDFDLDEDVAEAAGAISVEEDDLGQDMDGFEDLDLTEEPLAEASVEEDDLGLDLDMDLDGFEDLDLTEESSVEASIDEEDLGIELEAETETDDLGLDLDLDEFDDLDLDLGAEEESSAVGSESEVEDDDFDLDFDLDSEEVAEEISGATAEEEDFDLDFDLDAEEETGAEEETFELDLNIEPEPVDAEADSDEFDLDLDFDDDLDASSVVAESFVDDEDAATKTEEFDLTQIEDVLDFDELPEPGGVGASENLDGLEMDLEESEPNTVADDDEMSIDLETMLDDEDETLGDEKEVSLETVEEREEKIEQEYKKTVIEEREVSEEFIADVPGAAEEQFEEKIAAQMPAGGVEGTRSLKKILIPLILLIVVGVLVFVGMKMFGGKEEMPVKPVAPVVKDQGNLQIEMIANPEYKFVENKVSGEILVVTGNVTNRYDHPRSNIHVKGTLYNSAGEVIVTSLAYCGNMLTDSDLTTLELTTIRERLNNRMGDENLNIGIETGKNIPFTVVFSGLSEDVSELTVEVLESVK